MTKVAHVRTLRQALVQDGAESHGACVSTPGSPHAVARRVVMLLAIMLFLSIDGPGAGIAEGANLSSSIASVRRGQIYAEASMRSADAQLKSLNRDRRVTRKRVKAATHRLARLKERRQVVRERADAAADELALFRLRLQLEPEPPVDPPPTEADDSGTHMTDAMDASLLVTDALESLGSVFPTTGGSSSPASQPQSLAAGPGGVTPADVRQLESEAKRTRKAARKVERKTRRAQRARSALVRAIPRIRYQMAATVRRREGYEAVLGSYIRSMSTLAHKRVAKKTKLKNRTGFAWPIRGRISQGYHRGHDGLDLVAARGASIRAMAIGVVAYVGWNPWDAGRRAFVVVVAHPGGYETVYAHLLPIRRVTVGRLVKKGQLVGHMGNTGHSTGVHLHLEVRRGFQTINPLSVL